MLLTDKNKYFLERTRVRYGEDVEKIYDYSKVVYERAKSKLTIRCKKHDSVFTQRADLHMNGSLGCKVCRHTKAPRAKVTTTEGVIKLGTEIHKGLDTYERLNYVNSNVKIIVTCKIHGDYEISSKSYLQGARCGKCGVEDKHLTVDKAKKTIVDVHGYKYEYDWSTYKNSSSKMRIKCPTHGWFTQRVNAHLSGAGCGVCGVKVRTFTQDKVLGVIKEHFRNRYTYEKLVYVNDVTEVIITCKKHGDFHKIPHELMRGNGCTKCKESKPERDMINILDDNHIEYVQEHRLLDDNHRYDMYLPVLDILIEVDGIQHYESLKYFGGDEGLSYNIKRDTHKNKLASKHNIPLIRIPYFKFDVMEEKFFEELSTIYKYRKGDKFYKLFINLLADLKLPASTTKADVVQYLTYKKTQSS